MKHKKNSAGGPPNKKFKKDAGGSGPNKFKKNAGGSGPRKFKKNAGGPAHKKNNKSTKVLAKELNKLKNSSRSDAQAGANTKDSKDKTFKYQKPTTKFNNSSQNGFKSKESKKGKPNLDIKKDPNKPDTTGEKPNWLEYKKQQKDLRETRRAKKLDDAYDIAVEAKKLGEKLRRVNLPEAEKGKLTKKLHDLMQDKYAKMIFTHDLSRVIQWQIKHCNTDIRLAIAQELKPHINEMFFSMYAKNVIRTLMKKGSDDVKKVLLQSCFGHVVKLVSSVISSSIFEKIYVEVASDAEKYSLKQELYGDMYKKSKDPKVKTLIDVYKSDTSMKTATLSAVKANLIKILNKNLINSSLIHTLLYEYLSECTKDDRAEMIVNVRPLIAELSQTRDGAKAGNLCIWHGTNKDRKHIMKTLKDHIKNIMTSEHGYLMVLGLLDSVDDTVLLKKILLQEVLNNISEIAENDYGKRVILYIVARRDTHYFHPADIEYLKQGDGNATSKKPADVRAKELLDNVIDSLVESITVDLKKWLANGPIQLVTLAILKAAHGDKPKSAFGAIAKFISDPESKLQKDEETSVEAIEDSGLHMILKKLIQMDKTRIENNELTFGEELVPHLSDETLKQWLKFNRACFLLVLLFENESETTVSELKLKLQKHVSNLKKEKSKGATILLKKIDSCK